MILLEHPYIDWLLTAASAVILNRYMGYGVLQIFIILILISIPIHVIFKVNTNTNALLNLNSP